jgi:hypothetical protein
MRGTGDLSPGQVPSFGGRKRRRKLKGRAQPYRRNLDRIPGPTLTAMVRGSPFYLKNPADFQREMQKKRGR